TGDAFDNKIEGLNGGDLMKGLGGNDNLIGGAGADKLYGGIGNDRLDGSAGDDDFYFVDTPGGANADTIVNFASTHDQIYLDDVVFAQLRTLGPLSAANFRSGPGL